MFFKNRVQSCYSMTLLPSESLEPCHIIFTGRQSKNRPQTGSQMSKQLLVYWNSSNMLFAKKNFKEMKKAYISYTKGILEFYII